MNEAKDDIPRQALQPAATQKNNAHFCSRLEFGSTMQRDWLKFPTMQCSHHQKPSISSALWSDVPAHEQKRGRGKWRRPEKAQESRHGCFWVINKWETPFGIQTNQPLSPRTSFSHSASVEKTAADQARDYGIGMQQRAAMRFVGGSRPLWVSSQLFPRSCAGPPGCITGMGCAAASGGDCLGSAARAGSHTGERVPPRKPKGTQRLQIPGRN